MTADRRDEYLIGLVRELCKQPVETEWLEFKHNNTNPQEIGEYLSALSNSAALCGKANAYLVWGIENDTHKVVGTTFFPGKKKVGEEELENWLLKLITPKIDFHFYCLEVENLPVVLLEIGRAFRHPVQFQGQEFIRVGSYRRKLKDFPEKERELWRIFDRTAFEDGVAVERVSDQDVLQMIDYPAYFDLLEWPLPGNREGILKVLKDELLIRPDGAGNWSITNLGAILFAKRLSNEMVPPLSLTASRGPRLVGG